FEKSWRICTTDRFDLSADASDRSKLDALLRLVRTLLAEVLSRKSVPAANVPRPRPPASKVTPWMFRVDLPGSLNTSLRLSPFSKLTPLKDESCAVVVICWMMTLYWLTRFERVACEAASATAALTEPTLAAVVPWISTPSPVGALPDSVMVWLA